MAADRFQNLPPIDADPIWVSETLTDDTEFFEWIRRYVAALCAKRLAPDERIPGGYCTDVPTGDKRFQPVEYLAEWDNADAERRHELRESRASVLPGLLDKWAAGEMAARRAAGYEGGQDAPAQEAAQEASTPTSPAPTAAPSPAPAVAPEVAPSPPSMTDKERRARRVEIARKAAAASAKKRRKGFYKYRTVRLREDVIYELQFASKSARVSLSDVVHEAVRLWRDKVEAERGGGQGGEGR